MSNRTPHKLIMLVSGIFLAITFGYLVREFKFFPYPQIKQVQLYINGKSEAQADTLIKRLKNDFGISPERNLVTYKPAKTRVYKDVVLKNKKDRRANPIAFIPNPKTGYYAVLAAMDMKENMYSAFLIDAATAKIAHQWPLKIPKDINPNLPVHGFAVLKDGSIIFNGDGLGIHQRISMCGKLMWQRRIASHHAVGMSLNEDIHWTFLYDDLIKVDNNSGEILQHITLQNIFNNNPDIDILGIRQNDEIRRPKLNTPVGALDQNWAEDPIHHNDIEPFPAEYTDAYQGVFNQHDLLISSRSINLVYVLNSQSGKIKWWNFGNTRRQHDPDWLPNGKIRIYDNNMHRNISRIIDIDPITNKVETVYQDEAENFYSDIRGKSHSYAENIVITIPQQGRFIDINKNGQVEFEFINLYEKNNDIKKNLIIMSAIYIPDDFFVKSFKNCGV